MSKDADSDKEVQKRITNARWAWYKLAEFWKKGSLSLESRLLIYNALIMTEIVYALESRSLPDKLL